MGFFNFGKKDESEKELKTTCSCGGSCGISDVENARFIVLGACCQKSSDTFENTKTAVAQLGFDDQVLNIGNDVEIAKYGVMQTPALVINSKVVSYGKLLSVQDVKKLIEKSGIVK